VDINLFARRTRLLHCENRLPAGTLSPGGIMLDIIAELVESWGAHWGDPAD